MIELGSLEEVRGKGMVFLFICATQHIPIIEIKTKPQRIPSKPDSYQQHAAVQYFDTTDKQS